MESQTRAHVTISSADLAAWIEVLPFPLAASLDLYRTRRDPAKRAEHLLDFYEASAAFVTCVLLAAVARSPAAMRDVGTSLAESATFLEQASFGVWTTLGPQLAAGLRRLSPAEGAEALGCTPERARAIASRRIWNGLEATRELRNVKSHTAAASPERDRLRLEALEGSLALTAAALTKALDGWRLVRSGTISFRAGRFHNHVEILVGQGPNPLEIDLLLPEPLEEDRLYLVDGDSMSSLPLPPLIRLFTDENYAPAVYFWSKFVRSDGEFVCRHLGAAPLRYADGADVRDYLDRLSTGPLGGSVEPVPGESSAVPSVSGARRVEAPDQIGDATEPSTATKPPPTGKLTGRALGRVLHGLSVQADPDHAGRNVDAILAHAQEAGVAIGGRDPRTVVSSALKITPGFERIDRGLWTWRPLDETVESGIAGADLRLAALSVARRLDPRRGGLSIDELKTALQDDGVIIKGPNQVRTVWHAVGSPPAETAFLRIDPTHYAWIGDDDAREAPPQAIEPVPGDLAEIVPMLDAALGDLDTRIARRGIGTRLTYFLGDSPIVELSREDERVVATLAITWDAAPHVRGVLCREVGQPGIPPGQGPVAVAVERPRERAALVRLAAAAAAIAAGHRPGSPEFERWTFEAVRPWIAVEPPFLRGVGNGHAPRPSTPPEGWQAFWDRSLGFAGIADSPLRGRRPTRQSTMGTSGLDGIYASIRFDAHGPMATIYYFARRTTPTWLADFVRALPQVEIEMGEPLVVQLSADGGVFILLRAAPLQPDEDAANVAATTLRRLTDAMAEWTARLAP